MKMCTLTINGKTYIISDSDAMKKTADSNLNMNNKRIEGVRLIEFGSNQDEYIAINPVSIDQETYALFLSRYYDDMKPPIIRNVSDGIEDNDAATVGQVKSVDLTAEKTLNDEQKAQARMNIGAWGGDNDSLRMLNIAGADPDCDIGIYSGGSTSDRHAILRFDGAQGADTPVLRGISGGVEDNDVATVGQLNAAVGDIETTLDSIIAIQEELIGIITFTIGGTTYTSLKGMTWSQWCVSKYNYSNHAYVGDDGIVYDASGDVIVLNDVVVQYGTTALVDGAAYLSL